MQGAAWILPGTPLPVQARQLGTFRVARVQVVLCLHLDNRAGPCSLWLRLHVRRFYFISRFSMFYSPSLQAIAVLPQAPRNGSPVPWLTSLYHKAYAGPYGDRGYPGNCSGELIKDLLRYYRPKRVLDPMTGSGTCADVCRELGIECLSFDIRQGRDACDPASYEGVGQFDFVWLHPPYWRQKDTPTIRGTCPQCPT